MIDTVNLTLTKQNLEIKFARKLLRKLQTNRKYTRGNNRIPRWTINN